MSVAPSERLTNMWTCGKNWVIMIIGSERIPAIRLNKKKIRSVKEILLALAVKYIVVIKLASTIIIQI